MYPGGVVEKIWLQRYEAGVPAEIGLSDYQSLVDLFEKSLARFPDRTAFICMGAKITYRQLDRLSRDFAAYLQSVLGLPRGERIAIMLPNVLQYPVCLLGALRGGYVVVNCNPLYKARELEYQLRDCDATTIVILENFARTLMKVARRYPIKHIVMARLGDMLGAKGPIVNLVVKYVKRVVPSWRLQNVEHFRHAMARGRAAAFTPPAIGQNDLAFLQYTGGTTGVSKGAMLTHGNMLANVVQIHAWVKNHVTEGEELVVTALPLYHIFAMTANCFLFIRLGGTNLLITNPRDISGFIAELAKYPFTILTGVNTLFNALLNHPKFATINFARVKVTLGGGAAVQKGVAERWKHVTGLTLMEGYGLTEASPVAAINPFDVTDYTGAIGLPLPSTDVAIRDDNGVDVPLGERGELCIRGPQVMQGYFNQPDETANVMMADGFLRTGDVAVMDDKGFIRIVDRKKDMILVSGFNVYPNEIEDVMTMHDGIVEAAAIGVPDDKTGEAVKLFVVCRDLSLTPKEIIRHCREFLTGYKVPSQIEFRSELPKTNVGKILRRELRAEAMAAIRPRDDEKA